MGGTAVVHTGVLETVGRGASAAPTREELLALVAEGDERAFAELYDQIITRVFGVVRRCVIDSAQSEEVTQEILLEVWQNARHYQPGRGGATTWILTMAHHRAVDRVRASQSTRTRDHRVGVREFAQQYDAVAESVEIRLEHERAKRAMAVLSDLQRETVTLAYCDGFTQGEIATMLGVPISTVKTRLRDGLIRLRGELGVA